ncbi:MAG TPA: sensor domain-containing diguanylate cyclase [Candidatus Limnocylindrales bacterium]|nr:sensor domain-containing diguanylate cyclase [Candidatus Limnocylindrales bacterium]
MSASRTRLADQVARLREQSPLDGLLWTSAVVLTLAIAVAWLRDPSDVIAVVAAAAFAVLSMAHLLLARRAGMEEARRDALEASLTRMLQGLSRSSSSDAVVQTIVTDLMRTARADHVVVIGRRPPGGAVEATLVAANPDVAATTTQLPSDALEFGSAGPGEIAAQLNRRVRTSFGLANTLAAPLVVDEGLVGALVLSRRSERWTAGDQRLLRWAAREVAAALQRAYAFEAAETQAKLDPLTGLPNRRYLDELLSSVAPGRRASDHTGALMIDIDHFKRLNDRHGHQVGDNVLRAVAEQIALAVRSSDTPARYGGEEFAVVLRQATPDQAADVAERIRRAVSAMEPAALGVGEPVTVSVGVAVASGPGMDVRTLIERADRALYRAKSQGRNRVAAG